MKTLGKDKVIYRFNRDNPIVYTVKDGDTFWVETDDCYSGQIQNENTLRPDIDITIMDCAVGPIGIENAFPGDVLKVDILAIQLADHGVMVTTPGLGILGDLITESNTKIIPIQDGFALFSDDIRLPLTPMIGVLGVYPQAGDIHCAIPGDHGSNMDTKLITIASSVYFPVWKEGAGLALGDLHACMGDGELSGTGIETAGRVCLKTTVIKGKALHRPVIETRDAIYMIASRADIHDAIHTAVKDMTSFLMERKGLNLPDAYRLLSAACDIQISELVNETITVRVKAPKLDLQIQSFL